LVQEPESDDYEKKMAQAIDRMKISTRQYAKRQVSWLKNKLLPAVHDAAAAAKDNNAATTSAHPDVALYLLDATRTFVFIFISL
jgi:tRNA dimethylallyltransferase